MLAVGFAQALGAATRLSGSWMDHIARGLRHDLVPG